MKTSPQTAVVPSNDFGYCPVLARVIAEGQVVGVNGKHFPDLAAISTVNNLRLLRQLVLEYRPKSTLEVGLAYGGSALALLASLREVNVGTDCRHTAIDPFQSGLWDSAAVKLVEEAGFSDSFEFIADYSSYALPVLAKARRRFGLIYVDGSHLFEDVFIDAYFGCELLEPGGVLVFDDCSDPHVAKVIRFLKTNYGDIVKERPTESLKKAIARRLDRCQSRVFVKIGESRRSWNSKFRPF